MKYKFRAKDEKGNWVYGSYIDNQEVTPVIIPYDRYFSKPLMEHAMVWVDKKTVGQYSGVNDNEGNEIYEGDQFIKLVKYISTDGSEPYFEKELCTVKFFDARFTVYQDGWGYFDLLDVVNKKKEYSDEWETGNVVGNIYDGVKL